MAVGGVGFLGGVLLSAKLREMFLTHMPDPNYITPLGVLIYVLALVGIILLGRFGGNVAIEHFHAGRKFYGMLIIAMILLLGFAIFAIVVGGIVH